MKIAICDDEIQWVNIIKDKIEKLHSKGMMKLEIDCFTDQEELLLKAKNANYHLVYLDIEMEGRNGIEVGTKLKEYNEFCVVIFVTAYDSYIHDAFRISAFQYIKKPIDDELFRKEFFRGVERYKKKNSLRYFKVREGRKIFDINEIIYVESYYNSVYVKTTRGLFITNYANLKKIRKEVMEFDFIRVQTGLIINMNYIVTMRYREAVLVTGDSFPVSMTHYRKVMEKYHTFLNNRA